MQEQRKDQLDILKQSEEAVLYFIVFLLPIIALGLFVNPFVVPKLAILVYGILVIVGLKVIRTIGKGSLKYTAGTFDLPVLLLAGTYIASTILNTPNKMEAIFSPGTASFIVAGALLYFVVNQLNTKGRNRLEVALFSSGVVFGLIALMAVAGVFSGIPQLPAFMRDASFTPLGSGVHAIIFLVVVLPFGIGLFMREQDMTKKALAGTAIAIVILSTLAVLINTLPGKPSSPRFPTFATSWDVTAESLKTSPLLGMGPGNYLTAFNRFRPLEYNLSDLWRVRFTSARSFYLTSVSETGLIGLASLIMIALSASKLVKRNRREHGVSAWSAKNYTALSALFILAAALLFFPASPTLLVILFILLALNSEVREATLGMLPSSYTHDQNSATTRLPVFVATLPAIIMIILVGYYATKFVSAEYKFTNSIKAVGTGEGKLAYDLMRDTIETNPYVDRYRVSYAQINLALANAIAGNQNITDQDRETITQLIQQAIREGKVAVALNPQRTSNWEVLARIYQALIPLAQGSDQFALQTFRQAIALDPINPDLRIALGGIYYSLGDYENALRVFELATQAKPDLANAHFNYAYALQELGRIDQAIRAMTVVLSLVDSSSPDYEVAQKALQDMQTKSESAAKQQSENLTPPQEGEEPILDPQIELPEDAEPPAAPEVSPSPSPSLSPSPSPAANASPSPTPLP